MKQIQAVVSHPLFLCALFCMTSAWDPDAGLVRSFTKTSQARVFASSNLADAVKANDGNDSTQWISHGCMPGEFYLYNELTNVLYQACQQGRCSSSSADEGAIKGLTDSNTTTGFDVRQAGGGGVAHFSVTLTARQSLRDVTVRGSYHAPTQLVLVDGSSEKVVATLATSDNYRVRDFNVTLTPATSVSLRSTAEFRLYDLGAVGQAGCVERLYVDMGAPRHVRVIRTRHWAGGHGLMSKLIASDDGVTWQTLSDLDPNAVHPVVTYLPSTMTFRYVGVEHREDESKYAKVYVWEIDAYDDSGVYGGPPSPRRNPVSLREMGHGTNVHPWLNWDTEYARWVAANVTVHVSVQFTANDFPVSVWNQPHHAAHQYGQAFARHFGPTHGNGLVRSVEVGNEPWDFPADFYTTLLDGMASGFKAGDPQMLVMPGAFQAHDPTSTGNYIGTRVTEQVAGRVDVINGHHYSWRQARDGSRHATYPEDPAGSFNEIHSLIRWCAANTPSKPLWMTEWGWDSPGGGQDCSKFPECTTEAAASAYAARGLLLHARLGVARSTWFFYGNLEECDDHVFCRSGLTSSKSAHFVKKGPYYTLEHLLRLLGHTHFLDVVQEDESAYVYVFGTLTPTHIAAWRPVDAAVPEGAREVTVTFSYSATPAGAWRLSVDGQEAQTAVPSVHGDRWTMTVSAMPTVVQLQQHDDLIG